MSQPAFPTLPLPATAMAIGVNVDIDRSVRAGRVARVVGGGVLAVGPVLVGAQLLAADAAGGSAAQVSTVPALLLVWLAALVSGRLAFAFARSAAADRVFSVDALPVASFVVPAVGVALVAPLSLHGVVGAVLWAVGALTGNDDLTHAFDYWVVLSLWGTVHVHVAFAFAMALAARRAADGDDDRVTLWPAVLLSLVPGLILVFPPLLVWGTGYAVSRSFMLRAARWREGAVL